jgi:methyltransferase (TIGR00027 family)
MRGNTDTMVRSENDSWGITDGVGETALGVAIARAREADSECPLFVDDYAQRFVDAAVTAGWSRPDAVAMERIAVLAGYAASRTRWFDEFFTTASANGINQAVILAAGLDARAWRLPWLDTNVVYEIDLPGVLRFKQETVAALGGDEARPAARRVAVPVDLRHDWPTALREAGFDPSEPTAWSAEGLLPYLSSGDQDQLFERIQQLSAPDSRIAVESFGPTFFDRETLAQRDERSTPDLWYIEERTDVADWLTDRGWQVSVASANELMDRYARCPEEPDGSAPDTVFIEARLVPTPTLPA